MNRILWAALIAGLVLLGFTRAVQTFGAPLVVIVLVVLLVIGIKIQHRWVDGHQASGLDALNQPGRAVTIANRTSRWWDAEAEAEHHWPWWSRWLLKILPYHEIRIGSLDRARKQMREQAAGRPVRPIDWTAANRIGGGFGGGAFTASGMTYDWCTCSERAMPLETLPDGSTRANLGAETCLCQCSDCTPRGSYLDSDGKRKPIRPRHWRERDAEHEVAVGAAVGAEYERRFTVKWGRRYDAAVALIEDIRKDRRDRRLAEEIGYVDTQTRRDRGEEVITDTDEWHYRRDDHTDETDEAERW